MADQFNEWAVLELMGHRRLAGRVSEQQIAGAGFIRIDVPAADGDGFAASQMYAPAAIYAITPIAEDHARALARSFQPAPLTRWELRAAELVSAEEEIF